MRAIAVIDGEHYAPVVRDALAALPYEFVAVWLAGGTEKLRGGEDYGVPVVDDLEQAIAELEPEVVVDLSDEPVLGPRERFRVASRVLAHGLPYVGPDFRFDPPELAPFPLPSLSVVGTGKRVGKTAVTGHLARLLALDRDVVVVAMGRGGPPEPEVAEVRPTLERLLELSREGRHAASDYLETAALAGVVTIGCRRCGGGLAGAPGESNVLAGAALAAEREPDLVVFDGSGASIPPIDTSARVLVTSAAQPIEVAAGYLNTYRILVSDLVVLTGAEEGSTTRSSSTRSPREGRDGRSRRPSPAACGADPRPPSRLLLDGAGGGPRDAGAPPARGARRGHRARLRQPRPPRGPARGHREADAEVFLVEIKAAAIDVVAEAAVERGAEVVFADNELVPVGVPDLDTELIRLADSAIARVTVPAMSDRRYRQPLPLGGEDGLPFSKGLMARALIAAGFSADRAYELALAVEADLAATDRQSISFERLDELAHETLGDEAGPGRCAACGSIASSTSSTCRSSCSSAARPVPGSPPSRPTSPTGSGSRASPRPTSSARPCARSSPASSCRRSITRASRRAARWQTRTPTAAKR